MPSDRPLSPQESVQPVALLRTARNVLTWGVALVCGGGIGLLMLPVEATVMLAALALGARDVRLGDLGFVLRQFTDLRVLRDCYPVPARNGGPDA